MAKPVPAVRLLRSLTRAAKAQRSLATTLLTAFSPAPAPARQRSPRNATPPKKPAQARPLPAPGTWLAAQFAVPAQPGQAFVSSIPYWLYLP